MLDAIRPKLMRLIYIIRGLPYVKSLQSSAVAGDVSSVSSVPSW